MKFLLVSLFIAGSLGSAQAGGCTDQVKLAKKFFAVHAKTSEGLVEVGMDARDYLYGISSEMTNAAGTRIGYYWGEPVRKNANTLGMNVAAHADVLQKTRKEVNLMFDEILACLNK